MTDSNLTQLAEQAVRLLAAALPLLLPAAQKVAEGAAQKVGADLTDAARRKIADLWEKLRRQPKITDAAHNLAANPDDSDALAALRLQLKKALAADATLAREVEGMLRDPVVQRVLAEDNSHILNVQQEAGGGPTEQTVTAKGGSVIDGVKQVRK